MENLIDCNYEADMFLMLFEFQSTYDPQSYEIFYSTKLIYYINYVNTKLFNGKNFVPALFDQK
jgi:hypothetical protein